MLQRRQATRAQKERPPVQIEQEAKWAKSDALGKLYEMADVSLGKADLHRARTGRKRRLSKRADVAREGAAVRERHGQIQEQHDLVILARRQDPNIRGLADRVNLVNR